MSNQIVGLFSFSRSAIVSISLLFASFLDFSILITYKSFGLVITPVIAEAATTFEFDKYTEDLGSPILPLKFLFVVDMQLSPSLNTPICPPRQGPQPGLQIIAPASMNVSIYPSSIDCRFLLKLEVLTV